ncbi:MAG: hypothetical protein FJX51_07705, partial [Alphaproteobacteria bacterium]|nr:hypothetical protein [Alphaproteobacteria bacterium]
MVVGGVAAPTLLSACALPPALSLASLAADGLSYAATKKSVQDHALSAAVGEDCALWRVVTGLAICRPNEAESVAAEVAVEADAPQVSPPDEDIQVAQLSLPPVAPLGTSVGPIASDAPSPAPPVAAAPAPAPASAPVVAIEAIPASSPVPPAPTAKPSAPSVYVVLASYGDAPRAEAAARAHGKWGAHVLEGIAAGRPVHRVVAGPYSAQAAA